MTDITLTTDTSSPEPKRMKVRMVEGAERYIPFRDGLSPRHAVNLTPDQVSETLDAYRLALDEVERERDALRAFKLAFEQGYAYDAIKAERDAAIVRADAAERLMPLVRAVAETHAAYERAGSGVHRDRMGAHVQAVRDLRAALAKDNGHG